MPIAITTNYAGTVASQYWLPALFEADTIQAGVVSVWDGVKDKLNIRSMVFAGGLQPRNPTPTTPYGTYTVTEKVLEVLDAMLYTTFNPRTLENTWESADLSPLLIERKLPATFESYVLYLTMQSVFGQDMEVGWWMSSTDYQAITDTTDSRYRLQFCDGFMKRIVDDPTTLKYSSPAVITTSNILTFLDGLVQLIITNKKGLIRKYDRMKFLMSPNTKNIWRQFLLSPTFKGIDYPNTGQTVYAGYEIIELNGFPDDTILFLEATKDFKGALHIGMNSKSDENAILMERTRPMDETYFIKALMKFNTQIKFANEIACVTTLTSASFTV